VTNKPHKQLIVNAVIKGHFDSVEAVTAWLESVIKGVNMDIAELPNYTNPMAYYCTDEGNAGYTGVGILETSHVAVHTWDEVHPHNLRFDLYSCSEFSPEQVFALLEALDIVSAEYYFFDRDNLENIIFKETYRGPVKG